VVVTVVDSDVVAVLEAVVLCELVAVVEAVVEADDVADEDTEVVAVVVCEVVAVELGVLDAVDVMDDVAVLVTVVSSHPRSSLLSYLKMASFSKSTVSSQSPFSTTKKASFP